MEQIKFYLDEHIHSAVAAGLTARSVDVLTVQQAGRNGLSDHEQLSFALMSSECWSQWTRTSSLLSKRETHAGIAYANPRRSVGELIRALVLLSDVVTPSEMTDHVEYV
jgi:hypothetical protein